MKKQVGCRDLGRQRHAVWRRTGLRLFGRGRQIRLYRGKRDNRIPPCGANACADNIIMHRKSRIIKEVVDTIDS
jgi:hypothetical protein